MIERELRIRLVFLMTALLLGAVQITQQVRAGSPDVLDGTGDLFSGWAQFSTNTPPVVCLINTQNPEELRALVRQAGGDGKMLHLPPGRDGIERLPVGLKKNLVLRNRMEELSGLPCLLVNYTQVTQRDLTRPNIKALVLTAWQPRSDKAHERELLELIRQTTTPLIGFCGAHHLICAAYGVQSTAMRTLKSGEPDAYPAYAPGFFKEWNFMPVRIVKHDLLFTGLPDEISVPQRHYAECKQVPPEFELLASSEACRVQAIKHRDRPVYGLQFHPELYDDAHPHGRMLLQNFFRLAGLDQKRAAQTADGK
jgi:GMP synthase (glutamine-hydrolysing)